MAISVVRFHEGWFAFIVGIVYFYLFPVVAIVASVVASVMAEISFCGKNASAVVKISIFILTLVLVIWCFLVLKS